MAAEFEGEFKSNGPMHANFAVTRNPEIPSCLVEADFVSSPEGEEAIWNAERRARMAKAIAAGIDDWCKGLHERKEK
jgi:N-acetylmuramoyl-L-alanine amidase